MKKPRVKTAVKEMKSNSFYINKTSESRANKRKNAKESAERQQAAVYLPPKLSGTRSRAKNRSMADSQQISFIELNKLNAGIRKPSKKERD